MDQTALRPVTAERGAALALAAGVMANLDLFIVDLAPPPVSAALGSL